MAIAEQLQRIADKQQLVYDAGKQDEYDYFWDKLQNNGAPMTRCLYSFANNWWSKSNFKPKYSMRAAQQISFSGMFAYWAKGASDINERISFIDVFDKRGLELDFSNATNLGSLFNSNMCITEVGTIDGRNCTNFGGIFAYCYYLEKIEKLILKDTGSTGFDSSSFVKCDELKHITIEGYIGSNISFVNSSKLTIESIDNIVAALKDFSGTATTQTLMLHSTVKNYLENNYPSRIVTITQKGWTLA